MLQAESSRPATRLADAPAKATAAADAGPADEIEEIRPADEKQTYWGTRLASIIAFLALWEIAGRNVNPLLLSYPSKIVLAFADMVRSGEIVGAIYESGVTLTLGFVLAAIIGVGLGLLIGRYRRLEASLDWLINGLYATPLVAIVPLVTLWFGLGFSAKLFIVGILSVFPILINTASGVRNVPLNWLEVGSAFDASEKWIFTKIILPASLPYIMTGLRLGIGRSIIGMVVAEFYTAVGGLGALIMKYGNQYDTAAMFVPILALSLLGVVLTIVVRRAEEYFEPWKAS